MTPKDKAIDLIDKMRATCLITDDYVYKSTAKQCAIIAVDEIIDTSPMYYTGFEYESNLEYWEQVRKEIEKL
jgi:hypothetical protein